MKRIRVYFSHESQSFHMEFDLGTTFSRTKPILLSQSVNLHVKETSISHPSKEFEIVSSSKHFSRSSIIPSHCFHPHFPFPLPFHLLLFSFSEVTSSIVITVIEVGQMIDSLLLSLFPPLYHGVLSRYPSIPFNSFILSMNCETPSQPFLSLIQLKWKVSRFSLDSLVEEWNKEDGSSPSLRHSCIQVDGITSSIRDHSLPHFSYPVVPHLEVVYRSYSQGKANVFTSCVSPSCSVYISRNAIPIRILVKSQFTRLFKPFLLFNPSHRISFPLSPFHLSIQKSKCTVSKWSMQPCFDPKSRRFPIEWINQFDLWSLAGGRGRIDCSSKGRTIE